MEHFEIWWERITGPRKFFDNIAMRINEHAFCTILSVPDKLPWRCRLPDLIKGQIPDVKNLVKKLYVADGTEAGDDIGAFLLKKYASENLQNKCKHNKTPADDFLIKNDILNKKIIWIKNITDINKWKGHLLRKYNRKRTGDSVIFILETTDAGAAGDDKIKTLKYSDEVSEYDIYLFASVVAADKAKSSDWRRYITFVAESLCGSDVESLASFIAGCDFEKDNILETFVCPASGSANASERRLWRAQIQAAFPLIAKELAEFTEEHFDTLKTYCLPMRYMDMEINNPYDLDSGMIVRLFDTKLRMNQETRDRIRFLHSIRNKLAHLKCCDASEICELLGGRTTIAPTDKR